MPIREAVISTITLIFSLLVSIVYGGVIPYDTICSNAAYTIRGNNPIPDDIPHHYAWLVSSDGGASWQRIPSSNHRDLILSDLRDGMTDMQVRRLLYKRYLYAPSQISESGLVGLVLAKGYRLSRTADTITPCMDSKGFEITTPLPATFEWRCVESGKILQPQSVTANSSRYKVRVADLRSDNGEMPSGSYSLEVVIRYCGGCTDRLRLHVAVNRHTVSPFAYGERTMVYGSDTWTVESAWGGVDGQRWTLTDRHAAGVDIGERSRVLSGLVSVPVPAVISDTQRVAVVEAVCEDYPDHHYQALLELEVRNASIMGTSGKVQNFGYTGGAQSVTLTAGEYRFECWGAGGDYNSTGYGEFICGRGGYVKGEILLYTNRTFYVYVGQQGVYHAASFNGNLASSTTRGGGGATDIRLVSGAWNNFNSLKSRIMVAGGGGGHDRGGCAGGLNGYNAGAHPTPGTSYSGYGATQTSGGGRGGNGGYVGSFGAGGLGLNYSDGHSGGGGGGGYYGGGGARWHAGGGGGSSFISGHSGCNAIAESSTASSIIHTGQSVHYSGLSFKKTSIVDAAGYQWTAGRGSKINMPNPGGNGTITGNAGHGYARITALTVSVYRLTPGE